MKTQIKTIIALTLTVISLTSAVNLNSASANSITPRAIMLEKNIKKISVSGNVELLIVQNKNEGIIYDENNHGEATVTKDGNLVRITSSGKETAKIILYIKDFYRIEASENAIVKNYGTLNLKYLQIFLKGNAVADINSKTTGLYSVLKDNAELNIDGDTQNHITAINSLTKINAKRLVATHTTIENESFVAKLK